MIARSDRFSSPFAGAFRVLDESVIRDDLASRREIKYALHSPDLGKLRRLLEVNCRRVVYNERVSTVRSIYFDNVSLSACYANLDGLSRRRKVRVRWYDALKPGENFFLEIKWRDNRTTGKHRFRIGCDRPLTLVPYRRIIDGLLEVLPSAHIGDLLTGNEPTVLVEYRREHFVSSDAAIRVTLDYDLAFYDQSGKRFVSTTFPARLHDLVVVEGKTPLGRENELRELFHPWTPRVGRCSKYVHGCRLLGMIPSSV